jgi:hypothetical protein
VLLKVGKKKYILNGAINSPCALGVRQGFMIVIAYPLLSQSPLSCQGCSHLTRRQLSITFYMVQKIGDLSPQLAPAATHAQTHIWKTPSTYLGLVRVP